MELGREESRAKERSEKVHSNRDAFFHTSGFEA